MTKSNRPLNQKTLMASPDERFGGSVVPAPTNISIQLNQNLSLRPHYLKKPKDYKSVLAGFPLLRKEPYAASNSFDKLNKQVIQTPTTYINKDTNQTLTVSPIIFNKTSSLLYSSESDQHSMIFYIAGSVIIHGLVLLGIYAATLKFPAQPMGNTNEGQPVDVVFAPTPTGSSGLTGEGMSGEEGKTSPPPPPPAALPEVSSPPAPEQSVTAPEPQTEELPPDVGEIPMPIPQQQKQTPKKERNKNHQYTYRYTPPRQQPRRRQPAPEQSNNPFANMQTLDFSENPSKSRRKAATRRLPQGSRSGMDMSTGPLVKNGRINVPYAAKISIKGVSDDYGDAINAWIRQHLYYPPEAAQNGEDGSASVHVALNRDGYVLSVSLTNSSGSDTLDAAITGMFRGAKLPKIPPDLPDHFELDLTINYILLRH
ncbi:energy transducer TonB [Commensalibacter communis]|uniref:energy transducer TonB n=1 Tax=Commensalibacter communis TaxID=2972786 RepID=UPI0022FFB3A8|nr:energy transducer TonB [Commensalibacter communis]CAI3923987.1 Periplasmic protein TonB [Commensalibacter communis]CAI3930659.1 Periplasmic protein TonB [Commensalibacter communis]